MTVRILIDRYIPFLEGVLDSVAEVEFLPPDAFTPERVRQADALIVRTRTRCDETLLSGSRVQFIATATIGFDHIDTASFGPLVPGVMLRQCVTMWRKCYVRASTACLHATR